jgi:hypothetical protein
VLKVEMMKLFVNRLLLKATLSFSVFVFLAGCSEPSGLVTFESGDGYVYEPDSAVLLGHDVGRGVLAMVNDSLTDVPFLSSECLIAAGAAQRIVSHRQGADAMDGTGDDDPFDSLAELDNVGLVGEQTLLLLAEAAERLGLVPVLELEGVPFTEDEIENTLALINNASLEVLDEDASIDVRAAQSLIYGRPFDSLVEVAGRPFVGPSALTSLKWFAAGWVDSLN